MLTVNPACLILSVTSKADRLQLAEGEIYIPGPSGAGPHRGEQSGRGAGPGGKRGCLTGRSLVRPLCRPSALLVTLHPAAPSSRGVHTGWWPHCRCTKGLPGATVSVLSIQGTPQSTPALASGRCSLSSGSGPFGGLCWQGLGLAGPEPFPIRPPCSVPTSMPGGWGALLGCFSWNVEWGAEAPATGWPKAPMYLMCFSDTRVWAHPTPHHHVHPGRPQDRA